MSCRVTFFSTTFGKTPRSCAPGACLNNAEHLDTAMSIALSVSPWPTGRARYASNQILGCVRDRYVWHKIITGGNYTFLSRIHSRSPRVHLVACNCAQVTVDQSEIDLERLISQLIFLTVSLLIAAQAVIYILRV